MSVRRELLERELHKLGFRRADGPRAVASAQPPGAVSQHPQADAGGRD